jgi:hypothetical protein
MADMACAILAFVSFHCLQLRRQHGRGCILGLTLLAQPHAEGA